MLSKSPRYAHTDSFFVNNYILKLTSLLEFENCKFIHRDFHKKFFFILTHRSLAHSNNNRFNTDISLSHVRTNLAANFVLHKGVKMYNSLPNYDLKRIHDFEKSERTVTSYLLNI